MLSRRMACAKPRPTYSVSPSVSAVNEGSTVSFAVSTTNVPNGTVLYWTNAGTSSAADFSGGQNSGSVTINSGTAAISRTLANDTLTEGTETIIIQIRTGSLSGTVVATSATVTINDTSVTAPQFSWTGSFVLNNSAMQNINCTTYGAQSGYTVVNSAGNFSSAYSDFTFTVAVPNTTIRYPGCLGIGIVNTLTALYTLGVERADYTAYPGPLYRTMVNYSYGGWPVGAAFRLQVQKTGSLITFRFLNTGNGIVCADTTTLTAGVAYKIALYYARTDGIADSETLTIL
jgi:hypothetical protein